MDDLLTVREVAELLQKSEETIKRWLRRGKFPNAFKVSDKQGWKIPYKDINELSVGEKSITSMNHTNPSPSHNQQIEQKNNDQSELVLLAYQAVTMTSPTETILKLLTYIGIKRTLEILLVMQQSPNKVKNPEGFIRKAISKGWTPTTLPIKKERNIARIPNNITENNIKRSVPFYNWLEED